MRIRDASRRYASALMSLSKQKESQHIVLDQLAAISQVFANDASIREFFQNPIVPVDQKLSTLKSALNGQTLSDEVTSTLMLLVKRGRVDSLPEMVVAFRNSLDKEEGVTRGTVRSATALDAGARKAIEDKINKVLNKKIILTYSEDPKLLGGVVAQVGGWTFDDSIDAHLKKLNEELNRRSN